MKSSQQYKRGGCLWMVSPFIALLVILITWAVISFSASHGMSGSSASQQTLTALRLINVALGFLGIIALILSPIGTLLGLRYFGLARQAREEEQGQVFDPNSGRGEASVIPPEAHRWSWAGLGAGWIWGIYHGVWLSLLMLIPFVNVIVMLYLGFKGRELAWRKNKWTSPIAFDEYQKKWDMVGIILLAFSALGILSRLVIFSTLMQH